jgi:hypothetical protein
MNLPTSARPLRSACALVAVLLLGGGCANVKPWERGTLADQTMRPDRDPLGLALEEHIFFSREATTGGRGVSGGGCGCN